MSQKKYQRILQYRNRLSDFNVIRQRRKTMAIHVSGNSPVEIRVPLKCPWIEIDAFVESRKEWIIRSIFELADVPAAPEITYNSGDPHYYLGKAYPLLIHKGKSRVQLESGRFNVRCINPDDSSRVQAALERFYKKECIAVFNDCLSSSIRQFPVPVQPRALRVRKMKSRWGSCSHDGELCLNTLLVQMPIEVIDFVITHELCHLLHFRHDRAFYALLDRAMPNWRKQEQRLGGGLQWPQQLTLF